MSQNITDNSINIAHSYMLNAVKMAVAEEYDKAIEEAANRAKEKRDEVVSSIALRLSSSMSISSTAREINIMIDKSLLDKKEV